MRKAGDILQEIADYVITQVKPKWFTKSIIQISQNCAYNVSCAHPMPLYTEAALHSSYGGRGGSVGW